MKAATHPIQRPHDARLLQIDEHGRLQHHARSALPDLLRRGDLLVANDAATLPASLHGQHGRSGTAIEVRLAGRPTLAVDAVRDFSAVVFGPGDHRQRTEERPPPPPLEPGDVLLLGPLRAHVRRLLGHPRLIALRFEGVPDTIWAGIARHGRPVQYAYLAQPLALWDSWTRIAALPVAFEPPSAGFLLDWALLDALRAAGIGFATLTHAAGLSSTGDAALDERLPLDEPYRIPPATVAAIERTRSAGGRIVALGTTVTRALEHAAEQGALEHPAEQGAPAHATGSGALQPGEGLATNRLSRHTPLRIVDGLVSGAHEPGSSHHALLGAFTDGATLARMDAALHTAGYRGHEYGDSVLLWRVGRRSQCTVSQTGLSHTS
ncbi:S-adenosylmethionine:tRNA ribosyltransferase-isomerase [Aquabacterium sp.]|uniref:S-adenosylmethionine:tRNA ribosyltransferase-isomerase n=1 Tax=Aquabacterium sp. TaxID=1872578 RepID=UPI002CB7F2B1|nr:S-adenosylmethionine:tRNA ribosyltransferase-isomerase [Aquabacterium sp.]HSW08594.1 S-adenosylmethionine:tRNA ribosyltransferase-isomerase [Aquabacterium sp.]